MKTINHLQQGQPYQCPKCPASHSVPFVETSLATTNNNKTRQAGEARLLRFKHHFKSADENWDCLQERSTKVYNTCVDGASEYRVVHMNVEQQCLNLCFTYSGSCPNKYCLYLEKCLAEMKLEVMLTIGCSEDDGFQSEASLAIQSVIGRKALNDKDVLGLAHLFSLITHTTENCFHNDK